MILKENTSILGIFLILVLCMTLNSCEKKTKNKEPEEKIVSVRKVETIDPVQHETFTGIIKEQDEIKLSFRIAGPVKTLKVEKGQYVEKGQLLAIMDQRDYKLKLEATQAEYDQVTAEVARYEKMYKNNNLTDNDYDKAIAGKKQIAVKLNSAKNAYKDTRLVAPFSGYIQTCFISEKEIINAGMPVVSLVDVSNLKIEVSIPGQVYIHKDHFKDFYCTNQYYQDQKFPLEFAGLNAKAGVNNLYKLSLLLKPDKDMILAPGMSVQVHFSYNNQKGNQFKLPLSAIFEKDGSSFIWQYENQKVKPLKITLGEVDLANNVTVTSGIKGHELIVTTGIHTLKNGETVKLEDKE